MFFITCCDGVGERGEAQTSSALGMQVVDVRMVHLLLGIVCFSRYQNKSFAIIKFNLGRFPIQNLRASKAPCILFHHNVIFCLLYK